MAQDRARLQFIFVIGRNVDDLDTIALSLFKGTPYRRVSLLSKNETAKLVRLSEDNGTLHWPKEAVARVWALTNGHPFLTQQVCSHTWEHLYADAENPDEAPTVSPADVDAVVDAALEVSRNTLEWLWDGLGPAERVVASALAEAGPGPITQAQLEQVLQESGVRVIIRELQNAPQLLQEWDIIEPADGGYRFRVELLRRWIAEHKPLSRVQEEMDRIEPVADNLYQAALSFYRGESFDQAMIWLEQAVNLNPNHIGANQLLADLYLAQGKAELAQQLLEKLEAYHPTAVRSRLIQAILAQAEATEDEDTKLALYEDVLTRNPAQREVLNKKRRIWKKRGDQAKASRYLQDALTAYQKASLPEEVETIRLMIQRREIDTGLTEIETLEADEHYQEALTLAQKLQAKYQLDLEDHITRLHNKTKLYDLYQQALIEKENKPPIALASFIKIITIEPSYKQAARHFYDLVSNEHIQFLEEKISELKEENNRLTEELLRENKKNTISQTQNPSTYRPSTGNDLEILTVAVKLTDEGQECDHNEDCVGIHIPSTAGILRTMGALHLVADGMGGHQAGEVASEEAREVVMREYYQPSSTTGALSLGENLAARLKRAVHKANEAVYSMSQSSEQRKDMKTTTVAAVVREGEVHIANVGNSRAYLFREGKLRQITKDHSFVQEQIDAGILTPEMARNHPQKSAITRAIAHRHNVEVDTFGMQGKLRPGDKILLCSDGLTGPVRDEQIADILRRYPIDEAATRLVDAANANGGPDNISVVLIEARELQSGQPLAAEIPPAPARGAVPTAPTAAPPADPQPGAPARVGIPPSFLGDGGRRRAGVSRDDYGGDTIIRRLLIRA